MGCLPYVRKWIAHDSLLDRVYGKLRAVEADGESPALAARWVSDADAVTSDRLDEPRVVVGTFLLLDAAPVQ